ncbi:MAG: hypothetical protein AAF467_27740 [Actinomycetota bacterium]
MIDVDLSHGERRRLAEEVARVIADSASVELDTSEGGESTLYVAASVSIGPTVADAVLRLVGDAIGVELT